MIDLEFLQWPILVQGSVSSIDLAIKGQSSQAAGLLNSSDWIRSNDGVNDQDSIMIGAK